MRPAILLELGPAVLGWQRCRDLDGEHGLAVGDEQVREAVENGEMDVASVELTAAMVRAAVGAAALVMAHADGPSPSLAEARSAIEAMIG